MKISFDAMVNAAYIEFSDAPVARTKEFDDEVMIDLDEYDVVVGIEFLNPGTAPCASEITKVYHVKKADEVYLDKMLETVRMLKVSESQLTRSTPIQAANRWSHNGNLEPA